MNEKFLKVHPDDDMLVAIVDLPAGTHIPHGGESIVLPVDVPQKHKFSVRAHEPGAHLKMYGITVAKVTQPVRPGERLTLQNIIHATDTPVKRKQAAAWQAPDVSRWKNATFAGYLRSDGRVGTRNYWIVLPLVFCENRNLQIMREAMLKELGFGHASSYAAQTAELVDKFRGGVSVEEILATASTASVTSGNRKRVFQNVDGIRFLSHREGCGAGYNESQNLCGLLAGYINHPNVAGATVLSLGCQKSQIADLQNELHRRNPEFNKPLYIFEQQQLGTVETLLTTAIKHTFAGLMQANENVREPAPISQITLGAECGGSDGFSGLTANPAIGHTSDLLVALGGSVILSEFPELAGCESALAERCVKPATADRFLQLMEAYEAFLNQEGNSFEGNPSPGNIRDGLTTDAIKSAGAAKKGGTSPVVDVLDYPEPVERSGLNLLCTPGGDVESTTAMTGSGANLMVFSTGLGTPTGNPITPVIKIASNSALAGRMPDIIDEDAGTIISQGESIENVGERLLECIIGTASGAYYTRAEELGQEDFIPWRRTLSM